MKTIFEFALPRLEWHKDGVTFHGLFSRPFALRLRNVLPNLHWIEQTLSGHSLTAIAAAAGFFIRFARADGCSLVSGSYSSQYFMHEGGDGFLAVKYNSGSYVMPTLNGVCNFVPADLQPGVYEPLSCLCTVDSGYQVALYGQNINQNWLSCIETFLQTYCGGASNEDVSWTFVCLALSVLGGVLCCIPTVYDKHVRKSFARQDQYAQNYWVEGYELMEVEPIEQKLIGHLDEKNSDSVSEPLLPLGAPRYRKFLEFFSGLIRIAIFTAARAGTRFVISNAAKADEIGNGITASSYMGDSMTMLVVWGLFEFPRWRQPSYRPQSINSTNSKRNDYELQRYADEQFDQSFRQNKWRVATQFLSQLMLPVVLGTLFENRFLGLFTDHSHLDHEESLTNALLTAAFFVSLFTVGISYGIDKCFRRRSESFLEQLKKRDKNQFKMAMGLIGYDPRTFCQLVNILKQKIALNSRMKVGEVLELREGKEEPEMVFMDSKEQKGNQGWATTVGKTFLEDLSDLRRNDVKLFPYFLDKINGAMPHEDYGFLYAARDEKSTLRIVGHHPSNNPLDLLILNSVLSRYRSSLEFSWQGMWAINSLCSMNSGPWVIMQIEALLKNGTDLSSQPHKVVQKTNLSEVRLSQFSWIATSVSSVQRDQKAQQSSREHKL